MRKARTGFAVWAALVLGGCATAPDIHRRVQDEVAAAVRLEAGRAAEPATEAGSVEPQALETILADVIRANHSYRMAVAEGEASEVRRAAAHQHHRDGGGDEGQQGPGVGQGGDLVERQEAGDGRGYDAGQDAHRRGNAAWAVGCMLRSADLR